MRVAPVALYCWDNLEQLTKLTREVTEITHTNKLGIYGAILQAFAIQQALHLDPAKEVHVEEFSNDLLKKMDAIEAVEDPDEIEKNMKEYQGQLKAMQTLLTKDDPTNEEVVNVLGHSVSALFSVPTAIYCFLRNQKVKVEGQHPFRSTLELAINLGGDTDTIASMSCAISGALYGDEVISPNLLKHLEAADEMRDLADKLFQKVIN